MVEQALAWGGRMRAMMQGEGLRAQLLRGGVGSIAVKIAATGLAFAVAVVLARALGPEGYGIYAYVFALISLLAIPAEFGLPNLVVRETAKAQVGEQWGLMRGLWRWASTAAGAIALVLALGAGALAWIFGDRFTTMQLATFGFGLILVPLIALGNLRGAALRGLRRVVAGQLPETVLRPAFLIALVLGALLLWPTDELTPAHAMAFHALAAAAAFGVGAAMLIKARPEGLKAAPKAEYRGRVWAGAAVPLALVGGMLVINQQLGTVILGVFRNAEDVGIYRVALQGGMLVVFGLQAIDLVVGPHFARFHKAGDVTRLQQVATLSARVSVGFALPVLVAFFLWGDDILGLLFGYEFSRGHAALVIIATGQFANAATGSVGFLLNMTGHERDTARSTAIAAVCNIILSFALIPSLGMIGAALAAALTLAVWKLLLCWHARRRLGIGCDIFPVNILDDCDEK